MQCKDIDSEGVVIFVKLHGGVGCNAFGNEYKRSVTRSMPPETPERLVRAKMKQLIKNGYITGCTCGCRGDYEITPKGRLFLEEGF